MHYGNHTASGGTIAIYINCNLYLLTRVLCKSPAEAEARLQVRSDMLAPERVPHLCAGKHFSCVKWLDY